MAACTACGSALRDNARFCPSCGATVAPPDTAKAPTRPAAGKAAAPLPPTTEPLPGPAPAQGRTISWPVVAFILAIAAVVVTGAVVVFVTTRSADEPTTTAGTAAPGTESASPATTASTSPPVTAAPTVLSTTGAVASFTRAPVPTLNCGGSATFGAGNLIDGDLQTGWGAFEGDATGQNIRVTFAGSRRLTRIGLTPGFLKVAPRRDQGCTSVPAFPFNRFVTSVRYDFDDGTSATQSFQQVGEMQYVDVDAVTSSVTITILGTQFQSQGGFGDEDTILSEAEFVGVVE